MCGILFEYKIQGETLGKAALNSQAWRGPDNCTILRVDEKVVMGHNRLAIIDPTPNSNQPFVLDDRYHIVFNGEIYNYKELKHQYSLVCKTESDTEVLLRLYLLKGESVLNEVIGMFAFVIYDRLTGEWIAARDQFGIKPLYYFSDCNEGVVFASEVSALLEYGAREKDEISFEDWKKFRRPVPGYTFYKGICEVLPGTIITSSRKISQYFKLKESLEKYSDDRFIELLNESIIMHTVSDVPIASLISGGVDSNIVALLSQCEMLYTTGMTENNEGAIVHQSNNILKRKLIEQYFGEEELRKEWTSMARVKMEPLLVPNEGLISLICKEVKEKVVLTGEGADELLFGYHNIFNQASKSTLNLSQLLELHYCYSNVNTTDRMKSYLDDISNNKDLIDSTEDFFIQFHLPCLLRRMDFASMYQSKEARVPFVNKKLFEYMYRRPYALRARNGISKWILKKVLLDAGLNVSANTPKVGFEAKNKEFDQKMHYKSFQKIVLESLE